VPANIVDFAFPKKISGPFSTIYNE